MADNMLSERLQPSLLDRLTDNAPEEKTEARSYRAIDMAQLREIIKRDLSWLLNTNSIESMLEQDLYPNVRTSVLNYGVSEVAGEYSTKIKAELIRQSIQRAISIHEPRIIPGTASVEIRTEKDASRMIVSFDIHADMWAQPVPIEVYLRSKVDMTSGEVELEGVR
ncbi:MAG: type VI secretion system baseplate subunit TssE [Pseudomonadota bacterium]